jgi:hypothetical protein
VNLGKHLVLNAKTLFYFIDRQNLPQKIILKLILILKVQINLKKLELDVKYLS